VRLGDASKDAGFAYRQVLLPGQLYVKILSMNFDAAPKQESEAEPKEDKTASRRSFLKAAGSFAASSAITTPFSAISGTPIIVPMLVLKPGVFGVDPKKEDAKVLESESKGVFIRSSTNNFLNIGVQHRTRILDSQLRETILGQSILEADIVLLENTGGPYFSKVADFAQKQNKTVINIDHAWGAMRDLLQFGITMWATFRSVRQLGKDPVALGKTEDEKLEIRKDYIKYVLTTLGISELGLFPPTFLATGLASSLKDPSGKSDEYFEKYDISATGDGRTVFMAIEVLKERKKNPDKKIVVVTGDTHAKGINYYLNDAEGELKLKNVLYNVVYGFLKYLPM
jgi:hypothetical protein